MSFLLVPLYSGCEVLKVLSGVQAPLIHLQQPEYSGSLSLNFKTTGIQVVQVAFGRTAGIQVFQVVHLKNHLKIQAVPGFWDQNFYWVFDFLI